MTQQAVHDTLPAPANRQVFIDRLERALVNGPNARPVLVAFCDLDDFKYVDDTFGRGAGDRVLVEIAERLSYTVRAGDTVVRLGGDEFAILMEGSDLVEIDQIFERLLLVLSQPIELDGQTSTAPASIGLAEAGPGDFKGDDALDAMCDTLHARFIGG